MAGALKNYSIIVSLYGVITNSAGIHMMAIGITDWMNEAELIDIASYPRDINVVKVEDVKDLLDFSGGVGDLICNGNGTEMESSSLLSGRVSFSQI